MSNHGRDVPLEIRVNTVGFFANNLRGYEPDSILREQLQNADDACVKQRRSGVLDVRFLTDRLVVANPSVFDEEDWQRLLTPSSRGKFHDTDQTGEFGIGFWGALHLTDAPVVSSGARSVTLDPRGPTGAEIPYLDGSRFEFPYRREDSDLSCELDVPPVTLDDVEAMAASFVNQVPDLLLFTRAIDTMHLVLPDGTGYRAHRDHERVRGPVSQLVIRVDGHADAGRYLIVRAEISDPPPGRHGRVTAALPLSVPHRGQGRAFFMFPTETDSGLHLSIDAHFWATDDRRSLQHTGPHGQWNDRIFTVAGQAVGQAIETILDPAVHGLDYKDALSWFATTDPHMTDIRRRSDAFLRALDSEARHRKVVLDRSGSLRETDDIVRLPSEIEPILGDVIGDAAAPLDDGSIEILKRWGLRTWDAARVARWIRDAVPQRRTPRSGAPPFLRDMDDALTLLEFCAPAADHLGGAALLLGTDDAYHPVKGSVALPTKPLRHLLAGLDQPLVAPDFEDVATSYSLAPPTTPQWLRMALLSAADRLIRRRVPLPSVAVASKQAHVAEAVSILVDAGCELDGVPLALDDGSVLQAFSERTLVGLPQGAWRKSAEKLARRLGWCPVHHAIEDEAASGGVRRFDADLLLEAVQDAAEWDASEDPRLLVEVVGALADERRLDRVHVEQLRALPRWPGSDGAWHTLDELHLPSPYRDRGASQLVVAHELFGEVGPSDRAYHVLQTVLNVDVLDATEEAVLACEKPPRGARQRRELLFELADCAEISPTQKHRLASASFVLCEDGRLRRPGEVLLTEDDLPPQLGDRCLDAKVRSDRKVRERLAELGAAELPDAEDLVVAAEAISRVPVPDIAAEDPSVVFWNFLLRRYNHYGPRGMAPLGSIPWLRSNPGPERRKPEDCYDPQFVFAALLYPVVSHVASPLQTFREALRIRNTLETSQLVELGRAAAERGVILDTQFFTYSNRRCAGDEAAQHKLGELASYSIIRLTDGRLVRPAELVTNERAVIWGHLRFEIPPEFAKTYPHLLRSWGVAADSPDWTEHRSVIDELAMQGELDERDRRLVHERLVSLARLELNDHQLETYERHGHVLTTLGLVPCREAFRNDLPVAIVDRLGPRLAIVEETSDTTPLLDQLAIVPLSQAVSFEADTHGRVPDETWRVRLEMHSRNVLRFIKYSGARIDHFLDRWPPTVVRCESLSVRAWREDDLLAEWDAEAHLSSENDGLVLYVSTHDLSSRAVVDAIRSQFGVVRGMKSLLLSILDAPSAAAGEECLDYDEIPRLTDDEERYVYVPEPIELDIPDAGQGEVAGPTDVGIPESSPDGSGDRDRPQSPRGTTDYDALTRKGFEVVDRPAAPADGHEDEDFRPGEDADEPGPRDEVRVCLSFFDVHRGLIPLRVKDRRHLSSGAEVREVIVFGEARPAQVHGDHHIAIDDGARLYHQRLVVPGTLVRLHPGPPGTIEVEFRADRHRIDGVWLLELDDAGNLQRVCQDDIELEWETDDFFYRAERRLEDIEALMADGGKSALQLVIEVFEHRQNEGLTADEVWHLVAISRLFAKSTIPWVLARQPELFECVDGRWYMTGTQVHRNEWSSGRVRSSSSSMRDEPDGADDDIVAVALRLVELLRRADQSEREAVARALGPRTLENLLAQPLDFREPGSVSSGAFGSARDDDDTCPGCFRPYSQLKGGKAGHACQA